MHYYLIFQIINNYDASTGIVTLSVPEPSCALLGLLGMAALLAMRRRA